MTMATVMDGALESWLWEVVASRRERQRRGALYLNGAVKLTRRVAAGLSYSRILNLHSIPKRSW